jgi:hypothetical protein
MPSRGDERMVVRMEVRVVLLSLRLTAALRHRADLPVLGLGDHGSAPPGSAIVLG